MSGTTENRLTPPNPLREIPNAEVLELIEDAAATLSGITDALAYRTAVDHDDMLELLAEAAERQAEALRAFAATAQ